MACFENLFVPKRGLIYYFESMGYQLYCDNIEQFKEKTYGMFGDFDWKEFLQKEFKIDMSDI